jgi:polar amino acid transport system substrate-binding protein
MASNVSPALRDELAPTGTLRVALNLSNNLLTSSAPADGEPSGIAPDLGRELARRLGVPLAFVRYPGPGDLVDAVSTGAWDIGLVGADPLRAGEIIFTPAYLEIEATYIVPADSPIQAVEEVDRPGNRIAVPEKTAYDMYLRGALKHATLHHARGADATYQMFVREKLDAMAGLKVQLVDAQAKRPGTRVLDGRFTAIQQAIGTPIQRTAAAAYLREFVADIKSGLVAQLIAQYGVQGVAVASE